MKTWLDAGLAFFYPEVCQICDAGRATPKEGYICAGCRESVRFIRPPFCGRCGLPYDGEITTAFECGNCRDMKLHFCTARSAVVAAGLVREVIHRYKYNGALWFEPFLADLLVRVAGPVLRAGDWHSLVPVPLHPTKRRTREFNQAERLGRQLSMATGIRLESSLLQRVTATQTQTHLSRLDRARNVDDAFALRQSEGVEEKRLVLIDDVFTTGATTNACARVLRAGGAAAVSVWTLARGI